MASQNVFRFRTWNFAKWMEISLVDDVFANNVSKRGAGDGYCQSIRVFALYYPLWKATLDLLYEVINGC